MQEQKLKKSMETRLGFLELGKTSLHWDLVPQAQPDKYFKPHPARISARQVSFQDRRRGIKCEFGPGKTGAVCCVVST